MSKRSAPRASGSHRNARIRQLAKRLKAVHGPACTTARRMLMPIDIIALEQIAAKLETLERTREGDISILSRALVMIIRETREMEKRLRMLEAPEQSK